jgi:SAM-dependent methyltransferase
MSSDKATPEDASSDQSLLRSAPVARALAIENCPNAIGGDCTWYHGVWQYLRALGVLKKAGGHATFFTDTLRTLAHRDGVRRVLISGAADDAMALIAIHAFGEAGVPLDLTIVDRCATPLALSTWSAKLVGISVNTCHADLLDFAAETPFDAIVTSSFLAFVDSDSRPPMFAHWASLLRPGGRLLFTNRLRAGASAAAVGFSADQAQRFCAKVRAAAERRQDEIGIDPVTLETWTREYTAQLRAFPLRSVDEVLELLRPAGFTPEQLDTALFAGLPGNETVTGPSSADRGDYVRVLATRE